MEMALRGSLQRLRYNNSLFSVPRLSHKYEQVTATDISDNPASLTKFPVVHCEV